jgi:SAM-dependent methyltransferase
MRRIGAQGRKALMSLTLSKRWGESGTGLETRSYSEYKHYLSHQALKLDAHRDRSIRRHDARFHAALSERLAALPGSFDGQRVLCLAARQGTEVRAFICQGAFAVGIDLNPGRDNRYVMVGDFHDLQFADDSVDVVFTNSLDHVFDLDRVLGEVHRVLANSGTLICEAGLGREKGAAPGFYESLSWATVDDLLNRIQAGGFALDQRSAFAVPWPGEQLVLRKVADSTS